MPLYEYRCLSCHRHFERIERASSPRDGVCPECGAVATRMLGAPALQFKGSGWYVNDYAKAGRGGSSESEKESAAASSAATDSKSDATADAPSKTAPEKKVGPKVA